MAEMIKKMEEFKESDVRRTFGRGCACGCKPEDAEAGFDSMSEHNACGCPDPDVPANVS
mgnify:CR=1 FL=1